MKKFRLVLGGLALAVVVIGRWCVGSYNGLVARSQAVDSQWAQVQNVDQRRADLVPNLVSTVSGAANFEKSTLTEITQARAAVGQIRPGSTQAPTDPAQLAKRIIEEEIKPQFRKGDYRSGLTGGVTAIMRAVRGESRDNGTTVGGESGRMPSPGWSGLVLLIFFPRLFLLSRLRRMRGTVFRGNGRQTYWDGFGGGSVGGGGGFSGGDGSFGGGGASGRW